MPVPKPEPSGDLELLISGSAVAGHMVRIEVVFTEYPRSRHKRPISVVESRRVKILAPVTAKVKEDAQKAVIEIASDGIYDFRVGSESAVREGNCVLTIYGTSNRRRVKSLGVCKVGERRSIAKVLMPEGLLWEDESSFSGTIEDADSVTKYDSDTGLTWKEYKK